jgi:hypothetical protein
MTDVPAELLKRAGDTAQVLLSAAQDAGLWISPDNRVGIDDGAQLVGMSSKGFNKRLAESNVLVYQAGGGRHKRTIRIYDLALWLESLATPANLAA